MRRFEITIPWAISLFTAIVIGLSCPDLLESDNLANAMNAMITTAALIIGFIGAVLPVIMSLRNDSLLVTYVLEHDTSNLFYKYTSSAIFSGIILIVVAMVGFFNDIYAKKYIHTAFPFALGFFFTFFILNALRCLLFMLRAAFYTSNRNLINRLKYQNVSPEEIELTQSICKSAEDNSKKTTARESASVQDTLDNSSWKSHTERD